MTISYENRSECPMDKKIRCLFGTDGVRDVANKGVMIPEMVLRLARAYALFLAERGVPRPKIAIGTDTRLSCQMLQCALEAGFMSAGADVMLLGVMPTAGVSFAVRHYNATGGAVISASHNPAEYNGIKFFDRNGVKLSDDDEASIEEYLGDSMLDEWRPTGASIGRARDAFGAMEVYVKHMLSKAVALSLSEYKIVIDCANGAMIEPARLVFSALNPKDMVFLGDEPNGININEGVGVMCIDTARDAVMRECADFAVAFDGDGDRVLFVDRKGRVIDGDVIIWVLAKWLKKRGKLGGGVVITMMSNMALEEHLKEEGITVYRCPVGDRYVYETMQRSDSMLGGEQSGHIIVKEHVQTGDGLCTSLMFLQACKELNLDIGELVDEFSPYPQMLKNVKVSNKEKVLSHPDFLRSLRECEDIIKGKGRIFVRPSGTEPMVRILLEAKGVDLKSIVEKLASDIQKIDEELKNKVV